MKYANHFSNFHQSQIIVFLSNVKTTPIHNKNVYNAWMDINLHQIIYVWYKTVVNSIQIKIKKYVHNVVIIMIMLMDYVNQDVLYLIHKIFV